MLKEFSASTQDGRAHAIILCISGQRKRSSSVPRRCPATLKGWQGKPPVMMSTGPNSSPLTLRTFSKIGTSGQFVLSHCRRRLSFSTNPTVLKPPVLSSPSENPPMPENRSRTLSFGVSFPIPSFGARNVSIEGGGAVSSACFIGYQPPLWVRANVALRGIS